MIAIPHEQIRTLRNIHDHLAPGGRLLLHFFVPDYVLPASLAPDWTSSGWSPVSEPEHIGTYAHPVTGADIRLSFTMSSDASTQRESGAYYFEHAGNVHEIPFESRYTYPSEFELLLRLAGFERWEVYGSADCTRPFELSLENTLGFWVVHKNGDNGC